ncbi:MAG: SOS response-associated peptidase family protein [Planctomycetaceae bacterium]|nr:SOS response-associated peptidase family protein [Planctomycetaceae bacterium]
MCTNYVPSRGERLLEHFRLTDPGFAWRDEVFPGHLAPIIRVSPLTGEAEVTVACFGLIPFWSKDGRNYRHCYNARSETVAEKPSFRQAWKRGQFCIVPADAFFEPNYESGRPVRWRIERADGRPLALAGIWDAWRRPGWGDARPGPADAAQLEDDWLISFSMLTVNADRHPVMSAFHAPGDEKRSVATIANEAIGRWLSARPEDAPAMFSAPAPQTLSTRAAPLPPRRAKSPPPPQPRPKKAGPATPD